MQVRIRLEPRVRSITSLLFALLILAVYSQRSCVAQDLMGAAFENAKLIKNYDCLVVSSFVNTPIEANDPRLLRLDDEQFALIGGGSLRELRERVIVDFERETAIYISQTKEDALDPANPPKSRVASVKLPFISRQCQVMVRGKVIRPERKDIKDKHAGFLEQLQIPAMDLAGIFGHPARYKGLSKDQHIELQASIVKRRLKTIQGAESSVILRMESDESSYRQDFVMDPNRLVVTELIRMQTKDGVRPKGTQYVSRKFYHENVDGIDRLVGMDLKEGPAPHTPYDLDGTVEIRWLHMNEEFEFPPIAQAQQFSSLRASLPGRRGRQVIRSSRRRARKPAIHSPR